MAFSSRARHLTASFFSRRGPGFTSTSSSLRYSLNHSKTICRPLVISRSISSSKPDFHSSDPPSHGKNYEKFFHDPAVMKALLETEIEYADSAEEGFDNFMDQLADTDPEVVQRFLEYLETSRYDPISQDYWYSTADEKWQSTSSVQARSPADHLLNPMGIRLISWNIDALKGFADERMAAALQYLETLIGSAPVDCAVVVFLQEMCPTDLRLISQAKWVKKGFNITDVDGSNWPGPFFGATALVDRRLTINQVFRVPWVGEMSRDGLFIDIALKDTQPSDDNAKVLRLCNTHLESLANDPPVRPAQLAAASDMLKKTNVASALLAGDLNAIQPFDRTLHTENGLKDAYLELGGTEDSPDGFTWGYQVPTWKRQKYGCCRMDKILLRGDIQPKSFERIGIDVKVAEAVRPQVQKALKGPWVTDHYGVMGDFEFTGGWQLQT